MARRQGRVTRRMWPWAPELLMLIVILWSHQGNGQGHGRCEPAFMFYELDCEVHFILKLGGPLV